MEGIGDIIRMSNILTSSYFKNEMEFTGLLKKLKHLNVLVAGILWERSLTTMEILSVQNYLLSYLSLTTKRLESEITANFTDLFVSSEKFVCHELEDELAKILQHICIKIGTCAGNMTSMVDITDKLFHQIVVPSISCSDTIAISHIVFISCLKFYQDGSYDSVLQIVSWFLQNSGALLTSCLEYSLTPEYQVFPLLFSDIQCWKRSWGDINCLFRVLSSSCFIALADYSSALSSVNSICYNVHSGSEELAALRLYVTALASYKMNDLDKCLELCNMSLDFQLNCFLKINIYLLLSFSLSRKGRHYLSMQMLKRCLEIDASCRVAVLFLSHQFSSLKLKTSEIQSLQILYEMIVGDQKQTHLPATLVYNFISGLFISSFNISSLQVLWQLACCQMELERYDQAFQNFKVLKSSSHLFSQTFSTNVFKDDIHNFLTDFNVMDVYRQAIQCALKASQFSLVTDLCNQTLKKSVCKVQTAPGDYLFESEICIFKARGSYGLQRYDEALQVVSSAINRLEHLHACDIYDNKGLHNGMLCSPASPLNCHVGSKKGMRLKILCEAYGLKFLILTKLEKFSEAIHFSRLVCQLCPEDVSKACDLSLALSNVGRTTEGALMWIKFRKLISNSEIDKFHIISLIEQKTGVLSFTCGDEKRFLLRDIESLNLLCPEAE